MNGGEQAAKISFVHLVFELLRELKSANLGHEAVIEIMLALLGLMIAVLTLISGLLATGIAIVSWFGYSTIRDEAARQAVASASKAAKAAASRIAKEEIRRVLKREQASALTEAQAEDRDSTAQQSGRVARTPSRRKALSDSNLQEGDG